MVPIVILVNVTGHQCEPGRFSFNSFAFVITALIGHRIAIEQQIDISGLVHITAFET